MGILQPFILRDKTPLRGLVSTPSFILHLQMINYFILCSAFSEYVSGVRQQLKAEYEKILKAFFEAGTTSDFVENSTPTHSAALKGIMK